MSKNTSIEFQNKKNVEMKEKKCQKKKTRKSRKTGLSHISGRLSSKHKLNQYEIQQIECVQKRLQVFEDENSLEVIGVATNRVVVINQFGLYMRKVIQWCKSMAPFCALTVHDQLVILKHYFLECLMVRIAFMYDYDKNCFHSIVVSPVEWSLLM